MKRFEFRLSRVLDFRQTQAEVERSRLLGLLAAVQRIDNEAESLRRQAADARGQLERSASVSGEELFALNGFERHIRNRTAMLDRARNEAQLQVRKQQAAVIAAEQKVTLLLKLRQRKLVRWTLEEEKERETVAAESHLARLAARRAGASGADR
jgi:flagellar export protein FliJ